MTDTVTEAGRRPTVLVVDDEPFNVDLLCQELEDMALNTVCATNGREALAVLAAVDCDAMLLDMMMPEMDGLAVLQHLRSTGHLSRLPVIVISAAGDIAQVALCIEQGAEDYLTKPFDPVLLRARIGGALEKKRLRDQVARQLESTRRLFGKYVPQEVAETILSAGGQLAPMLSEATVLYTDIEGFTGIVETMSPGDVIAMLNEYFDAVLEPVKRYKGVVNQFQGDAMLVTFNLPIPDLHHREHAVRTAIGIQRAVQANRFLGKTLATRIGVNTGQVVAGNVGAGDRLHYTVHGDAVNVSARLEGMNKALGTRTLISGTTVETLENLFQFERLGNVQVRGKNSAVSVYGLSHDSGVDAA